MSYINDESAEEWIERNQPTNGLFKVYWKDVVGLARGGATLDQDEGEGLRYEWYYKDGKKDGVSKGWYPNGQIKHEWGWKNGIEDGQWKFWDGNGNLTAESFYKEGIKIGLWTWWYENGTKGREVTYKDGEYLLWIEWDMDGVEKVRKTK